MSISDFDFFKLLNDDSYDVTINDVDSHCLLSKEPLHDIHIVLPCNHSFNYFPLYKDVIMQKKKDNSNNYYYSYYSNIATNQIKCPYCRTIHNNLLPFIEFDNVEKKSGVNHPPKLCMPALHCSTCKTNAIVKNPSSDSCYCKKHYAKYLLKLEKDKLKLENASLKKVKKAKKVI